MRFRPCIDLHDGVVKQIVGSTLSDAAGGGSATAAVTENFSTERPAAEFAATYRQHALTGGHVIMLGANGPNEAAAKASLLAWPGGLQVGGGITADSARSWLDAGASHVIVTSYVFRDGQVDLARLEALVAAVGRERLVLDLSCRKKPGGDAYFVVTDRWQRYTDYAVDAASLGALAAYCDEFLVHGVEAEGKRCGVIDELVALLGEHSPIPVTYAGGATCVADLERVKALGRGRVDLTIGSALDLFGGELPFDDVVAWQRAEDAK